MAFTSRTSLIAAAFFILSTSALPYPVTYSVVNVDGGSTVVPSPTVVYQTVTQSDDSPETVSITIIQTPSTTAVVTEHSTQWTQAVATDTALIPEVSAQPSGHPTYFIPIPLHPTEEATVTVVSTMTPSPSPTTTQYYDNGMWHTSYAIKEPASASASHPGQWTPSAPAVSSSATGTGVRHVSRAVGSGYAAPSGYVVPSSISSNYGWNSTARY